MGGPVWEATQVKARVREAFQAFDGGDLSHCRHFVRELGITLVVWALRDIVQGTNVIERYGVYVV